MTEHPFSLVPFPDANIPEITITGKIARQSSILTIHFWISGKTETIRFPEPSVRPTRKDELWKATCFEFFVALPEHPAYWEFNISPSGDWNIYHMDEYRRAGFREETLMERLPFSVRKEAACISVQSSVDLSPILAANSIIQLGITSIIQTVDGNETYWALAHPKPQADFHLRQSFILVLAE